MNIQCTTTDITPPLPPVGQLAKTNYPAIKHNSSKHLRAGRQAKPNHRTHAHAGGYFNLNGTKQQRHKPFKLYKKTENDFLKTIPLLFDNLEKINVIFHNNDYVNAIFDMYYPTHAHLFLDWVKTFARIRKTYRTALAEGIIQTTDDDFLSALQLFKLQQTKPKPKNTISQKEKVWQAIIQHFPDSPFTSRDIADIILIYRSAVNSFLREMKEEGKIKRCKKLPKTHCNRYQLIQK